MILKRLLIAGVVGLLLVSGLSQAATTTIHTRYFESIDVEIPSGQFQRFSVSPLQGEKVTIVTYGLQAGAIPRLTLFDPLGSTTAEDLNPAQTDTAFVQVVSAVNGLYVFVVENRGDEASFFRIMVFEGEPLEDDTTILDTLDPFAPSRAFMVGGNADNPVSMTVDVIEPEDPNVVLPQVFASRGEAEAAATIEERNVPVPVPDTANWLNSGNTPFYTINIRPFPELLSTSLKPNAYFSFLAQSFQVFDYLLIIGAGDAPDRLLRGICGTPELEIVGITPDGEFYQVIDPTSDSGYKLVDADSVSIDLSNPFCDRVQPVVLPENTVTAPTAPPGNNGGGGGGDFGLPPAGDPPPPVDPGGSNSIALPQPPSPPPPSTFTASYNFCNISPTLMEMDYSGEPPGTAFFRLDQPGHGSSLGVIIAPGRLRFDSSSTFAPPLGGTLLGGTLYALDSFGVPLGTTVVSNTVICF
jgi:hypothetical protein